MKRAVVVQGLEGMSLASVIRTARLLSGLVLLAFVAGHLANLAFGLQSLAALELWRATLMAPWQQLPGKIVLGSAALVHATLGLYALASRRSLVLSATDLVQLGLGLLVPPLLINHALTLGGTGQLVQEFQASYGLILAVYWVYSPLYAFQQLFVVVVVWIHGALGLYSWLVLKPIWSRIGGIVLPILFAVPILALLGFAEAGKEVIGRLETDPEWQVTVIANVRRMISVVAPLAAIQKQVLQIYGAAALAALAILVFRILRARMRPVSIGFDGGLVAQGRHGLSILEFSRINNIPHAHVCSGRGRCGTCRVAVEAGAAVLSPQREIEREVLARLHAGPGVRLACQARVLGPGVLVARLLPAYADSSAARLPEDWSGDPTEIVVEAAS